MELSEAYLRKAYIEECKSTHTISKETGINQTRVRNLLKKYNIPIRTKSEAQSNALKNGIANHPTKGKKQSQSVKEKISDSMVDFWKNITLEEYSRRVEIAKEQWYSMSVEDKINFKKLAGKALREAAKNGSKLEKFLLVELKSRGYIVQFHTTNLSCREQLEVDLFLPELKIAIEIDGPAHFIPIWGQDNLIKHKLTDSAKTGLLIQAGYYVIRVKHLAKTVTEKHKRTLLTSVLYLLNNPTKLMEIELK